MSTETEFFDIFVAPQAPGWFYHRTHQICLDNFLNTKQALTYTLASR